MPEDLIEAITNKTETPAIVHAVPEKAKKKDTIWELEESFLRNFLGFQLNSKKVKAYNIFDHDPDFKNPNGWTLTVTKKQLKSLKRHNIGFLMVNLTAVSDYSFILSNNLMFYSICLFMKLCYIYFLNHNSRDQCWGHIGIQGQQR